MKNPCDNCIIKVNCTEICEPKKNYEVLLERGVDQYYPYLRHKCYSDQYSKLINLLFKHRKEKAQITGRISTNQSSF